MIPVVTTPTEDLRAALRDMLAAQRRMRGREAQRHGPVSFSQNGVLRVLADGEEHSAGDLAAAAELTPASLTKMLDGLERSRLVERVRDEADRRRVAVRITDAGRAVHDEKERELRAAWKGVLDEMDPGEIEAMATALRRVATLYDSF
jgi:DNA-binding MarR family transcriptional regulator